MQSCDRMEKCSLFQHFALKSSLTVWTSSYCKGDFSRCERFKLATAGQQIPSNLLPNGKMLHVSLENAKRDDTGPL